MPEIEVKEVVNLRQVLQVLDAHLEVGTITAACKKVGISRTAFYNAWSSEFVQDWITERIHGLPSQTFSQLEGAAPAVVANLIKIATGQKGQVSDQVSAINTYIKMLGMDDLIAKLGGDQAQGWSFQEFASQAGLSIKRASVTIEMDSEGSPPDDGHFSVIEPPELPAIIGIADDPPEESGVVDGEVISDVPLSPT